MWRVLVFVAAAIAIDGGLALWFCAWARKDRALTDAQDQAIAAATEPPAPGGEATRPTGYPPGPSAPPAPGHYSRRRPLPRHDCGSLKRTIDIWEGGCLYVWRDGTGQWEHAPCWRAPFDAEWDERLTQ